MGEYDFSYEIPSDFKQSLAHFLKRNGHHKLLSGVTFAMKI